MNEDRQSAYLNLIEELLTCPSGEETEILNTNSDLVDAGLTATLPNLEIEQAKSIAGYLVNFSNRMQEFPLGNRANNLEIAIAGYGIALTVFTRERFPQDWAMTQNNLGAAYSNRIRGEKAENLEAAIDCYREALKEYTRERFPQNHTETLFNLGLVYRETKQFQEAYDTFKAACDTVEFLRDEIISGEEAKQ